MVQPRGTKLQVQLHVDCKPFMSSLLLSCNHHTWLVQGVTHLGGDLAAVDTDGCTARLLQVAAPLHQDPHSSGYLRVQDDRQPGRSVDSTP
jgi:hypothetical protein